MTHTDPAAAGTDIRARHGDPFEAIAAFYDLDLTEHDADLPFYREIVAMQGRRVLELGCGTGRVAVDLAEAGAAVTGVDVSKAMLRRARTRSDDAGVEVEWIEADLLELSLGRAFDVVLMPLGTIQHMVTTAEVALAIERAAAHLANDGALIVDVEAPHAEDFAPGPLPLTEHWTRPWPPDGGQVTKLVAVDVVPSESLRYVTWHFDVQPPEGPLTRTTSQFTLRTITLGELELAGRLAGLETVASYGDYDFNPFEDGDPRLLVVLRPSGASDGEGGSE